MKLWHFTSGFVRNNGLFLIGQYTRPISGMLAMLLTAKFLSPEIFGIIQTVMLVSVYLVLLNLGAFLGLNRNVSYYAGKNDSDAIQGAVNASWMVAKATALIGLVVIVIMVSYYNYKSQYVWSLAALGLLGPLCINPFVLHLESIYRSMQRFNRLGKRIILNNIVQVALGGLPALVGVLGVVIRYISLPVLGFVCLINAPSKPNGHPTYKQLKDLVSMGLPIIIGGNIATFFSVSDRTIAAMMLSPAEVGKLSIATLLISSLQVIPSTCGQLLLPKATRAYAKSDDAYSLRRYFWMAVGLNAAALIPLAAILFVMVPYLIRYYLPAYTDGILATEIATMTLVFQVYAGVGIVFVACGKNLRYIIVITIGLVFMWAISISVVKLGYGIEGLAFARLIASGLISAVVLVSAYRMTKEKTHD